jgi:hypothetical protein
VKICSCVKEIECSTVEQCVFDCEHNLFVNIADCIEKNVNNQRISMMMSTADSFHQSLDELTQFADSFKLREHELEQQRQLEFDKIKSDFDSRIQLEKKRLETLQEMNQTLMQQLERATEKQIESDRKYTVSCIEHEHCLVFV